MNERIKELAHEVFSFKYKTSPYELNPGHRMDHLHKFAELIVRETLMQMAIQMNRFGDDQANNPAWYKSEEAVKKHFGVEE